MCQDFLPPSVPSSIELYQSAYEGEHIPGGGTGNQQMIIRVDVSSRPHYRYGGEMIETICVITLEASWCVDMHVAYGRRREYEFRHPNDEQEDEIVRAGVRNGSNLRVDDFTYNSEPHYKRDDQPDVYIFDPQGVLKWLGMDFASAPPEQMKQKLLT